MTGEEGTAPVSAEPTEGKDQGNALTPPGNILGDIPPTEGEGSAAEAGGEPDKKEGGEGAEGDKSQEAPKPEVPEAYEFKLPEGVALDEDTARQTQELFKELGLSNESGQKLMNLAVDKMRAAAEAPYKLWHETQAEWQKSVKTDPELGGVNYDSTIRQSAEVLKPGNPLVKTEAEAAELRSVLNFTGAGNHPAMVRLFARLGAILSEPKSLSGGHVQPDSKREIGDGWYPSMTKKED